MRKNPTKGRGGGQKKTRGPTQKKGTNRFAQRSVPGGGIPEVIHLILMGLLILTEAASLIF
jgi:hypothetical protein